MVKIIFETFDVILDTFGEFLCRNLRKILEIL